MSTNFLATVIVLSVMSIESDFMPLFFDEEGLTANSDAYIHVKDIEVKLSMEDIFKDHLHVFEQDVTGVPKVDNT